MSQGTLGRGTSYNRGLAAYLRRTLRDVPNLTVGSFHSTCRYLANEAGVELRAGFEAEMNDAILPNALLDAVDVRPDLKFDTIVVDEGQDFHDRWLDILRLCLNAVDDGGFFVSFDDNQIAFKRGGNSSRRCLPQNTD